jgi:hypothetical protein
MCYKKESIVSPTYIKLIYSPLLEFQLPSPINNNKGMRRTRIINSNRRNIVKQAHTLDKIVWVNIFFVPIECENSGTSRCNFQLFLRLLTISTDVSFFFYNENIMSTVYLSGDFPFRAHPQSPDCSAVLLQRH